MKQFSVPISSLWRRREDLALVSEANYRSHQLRVVCHASIVHGCYLVYPYIVTANGTEVRVVDHLSADSLNDASEIGFLAAQVEVDQRIGLGSAN